MNTVETANRARYVRNGASLQPSALADLRLLLSLTKARFWPTALTRPQRPNTGLPARPGRDMRTQRPNTALFKAHSGAVGAGGFSDALSAASSVAASARLLVRPLMAWRILSMPGCTQRIADRVCPWRIAGRTGVANEERGR